MAGRFFLGAVFATPAALALLSNAGVDPWTLLHRHHHGDWGDLCDDDRRLNDEAVNDGSRIFSSYRIGPGEAKVWIITDAADDFGIRRASTILTPGCY
jgi:hypothetical protein